jgi:hypothetical protein
MPVSGITTSSVAAKYTPPPAQQQPAKAQQKTFATDTVSISQQALQAQQAQQVSTNSNTNVQGTMSSGNGSVSAKSTGKA